MNDGRGESSIIATVVKWQSPLLVVTQHVGELIINTSSLGFVSAERDDEEIRLARGVLIDEWLSEPSVSDDRYRELDDDR